MAECRIEAFPEECIPGRSQGEGRDARANGWRYVSKTDVALCCLGGGVPHSGGEQKTADSGPPPSSNDEARREGSADGEQRLLANDLPELARRVLL